MIFLLLIIGFHSAFSAGFWPDVLVTACPLCKKTFETGCTIEVKDIAEMVADSMVIPAQQGKKEDLVEA